MRSTWTFFAGVALALGTAAQAGSSYPDRPIRLILPFAVGGSGDTTARLLANHLSDRLHQPIIAENRPGASGIIGAQAVLRSKPDGYTMLFAATVLVQNAGLFEELPYDPAKDFVPIAQVVRSAAALVVPSSLGVNSVEELTTYAKGYTGQLSYASAGTATTSHLYGSLLAKQASIDAVHVPYKGGGPAIADLLAGHVTFAVMDIGSVMAHVKAGKLTLLAATGSQRSPSVPQLPTFKELGYTGFDAYGWLGVFAPKGTPEPIISVWREAIADVIALREFSDFVVGAGMEPSSTAGTAFAEELEHDIAVWKSVAEIANVRANP